MKQLINDIARKNILRYPKLTPDIDKLYDEAIREIGYGKAVRNVYKIYVYKLNKLTKRK